MMCIAYANEMADACLPHNIDPAEVCYAASSKPFGYIPFTSGLGVGGPCIPVNPYYLLTNCTMPLLQAATESMWDRPSRIAKRVITVLDRQKEHKTEKMDSPKRVLVVGAGFKRGQSLLTHSPAISLMNSLLQNYNVDVSFADPLVSLSAAQQAIQTVQQDLGIGNEVLPSLQRLNETTEWTKTTLEERFDAIVVAVEQDGLDLKVLDTLEGMLIERYS
jgi:UDP-N-acetyl-D-mannosaminuronate dehydrogenase